MAGPTLQDIKAGAIAAAVPPAAAAVRPALAGSARPSSRPSGFRSRFRAYLRDPFFATACAILLTMAFLALSADLLVPHDPMDMVAAPLLWPGQDLGYPLGTDALGRDLLAGVVHGSRASLMVGLSAASIGLLIGATIGAVAGYFGGFVDNALMRLAELFQTVPSILLVIAILSIGEPSLALIAFAIGLASWPMVARLVRSQFLTLRESDFVLAARSLGYGTGRIIVGEILPNALPTVIVATSVMVANGILAEAGLSFLGLGDNNLVSWGSMVGNGRQVLRSEWYVSAIPGFAIVLTVLSFNILGDRLNDILNPRAEPA
ncbi:ABC transporter permease [Phreatobacter cathodiphilus]|uniref:ABC transporter permease n=1 Tax=Phreatobacter cathodiphilus TaxID=1868589 RepID=A0A2S0N8B7_9HYPH|nr:ABC transporter permease [Phreatobacter cathodiphilus]AVO44356.1 ABC transporter permease [Phreatobacter cathodiphilus]